MLPILGLITRSRFIVMKAIEIRLLEPLVKLDINVFRNNRSKELAEFSQHYAIIDGCRNERRWQQQ